MEPKEKEEKNEDGPLNLYRTTILWKKLSEAIQELKDEGVLPDSPYDLIFRGMYPPLHDSEKNFISEDWFEGYIDTYISRDVEDLINASNAQTFKKFIQICALHSGQMLSMDNIARNVGVTAPTIKSWLSIAPVTSPDWRMSGRMISPPAL